MEHEGRDFVDNKTARGVVFLDLDGVVGFMMLRPLGQVNEFKPTQKQHLEAIGKQVKRLNERGAKMVFNTGRGVEETEKIAEAMGLSREDIDLVCEHGTMARINGLWQDLLPEELAEKAKWLATDMTKTLAAQGCPMLDKKRMCTVQLRGNETEPQKTGYINAVKAAIAGREDEFSEIMVGPESIDVVVNGCNKGSGLRAYMEKTGQKGKTLAVGDAGSDIVMMKEADLAACPGDANDKVKEYLNGRVGGLVATMPSSLGTMQILNEFGKLINGQGEWPQRPKSGKEKPLVMKQYDSEVAVK